MFFSNVDLLRSSRFEKHAVKLIPFKYKLLVVAMATYSSASACRAKEVQNIL